MHRSLNFSLTLSPSPPKKLRLVADCCRPYLARWTSSPLSSKKWAGRKKCPHPLNYPLKNILRPVLSMQPPYPTFHQMNKIELPAHLTPFLSDILLFHNQPESSPSPSIPELLLLSEIFCEQPPLFRNPFKNRTTNPILLTKPLAISCNST